MSYGNAIQGSQQRHSASNNAGRRGGANETAFQRKVADSIHNRSLSFDVAAPRRMICADATSASGPACSRRAPPGVQRQRNASRHEA
jgi:hypothetical protein